LINEAKVERDKILREARESKESIINEAKTRANVEADRLIAIAREAIENQKMAAITDLQNSVAAMSIEIAEKVLRHELANDEKQKALMNNLLSEISSN
jgi:F-type H+-transporting ATPase subunit b